jgi:hypothetical protein
MDELDIKENYVSGSPFNSRGTGTAYPFGEPEFTPGF